MDQLFSVTGGLARAAFSVNEALDNSESLRNARGKIKAWQALDPFPYQPLSTPTSIRLIKLAPSKKMQKAEQRGKPLGGDADDDEDDIHFTMHTAELERNPRFTALSYTWRQQRSAVRAWGRQTSSTIKQAFTEGIMRVEAPDFDDELAATRKVTCNGQKMQVFENLFAALKQLRRRLPGEWLWIDAVCINQSDNAEIDKQIQIMGRIYQSARLVVVWLGSCPRIVDKGLDMLQAMAHSGEPLPEYPLYRSKINIGKRAADDWRLHYAAFTAFHLANRSWHKRVWVVQEVCLARQVIFLHGKHEVKLETLSLSCKWCLDNRGRGETAIWFDIQTMLGTNLVTHMQFLPATLQAREEFAKGSKWTLLQWLLACRGRSASEGKDFVFAGLSLVREDYLSIDQKLQASLAPKKLWPKLRPDSTVLAAEVFLNATACLLTHEPLEKLLRMSSRLRDKHRFRSMTTAQPRELDVFSGLPSWVIAIGSWTCGLTADLVPEEADKAKVAEVTGVLEALKNPGMSHNAKGSRPSISADGMVLSIEAAMVDKIASAEYETEVPPASEEFRKLMRFLVRAKDIHAVADEPRGSASIEGEQRSSGDISNDYHQPCLLEDVACAMVAGHIAGRQVTPSQAGPWLCESIQSRVAHLVTVTQRQVTEDQHVLEPLELKAKKHGHGIEYLRHMTDPTADTVVKQWREKSDAINKGLELVAGATGELEMLKTSYAHLRWPTNATVISREEDVARAKTGREDSWKKRLEELSEQRSTKPKSPVHFQGAMLDRAKMNASDLFDTYNDWSYVRMSAPYEQFRRMVSDECSAFEHASIEMLSWRKICLTRRGRVLLAPRWADDGDSIVQLPGVSTPFILTREEEDLVREDARIRDRLSQISNGSKDYMLWAYYESQLKVRLVEVQERLRVIAERDEECWLLVGEGYVQGRRHRSADAGLVFGRIDIA